MILKEYINRGWNVYKKLLVKRANLDSIANVISKYGEREIETYPSGNSSESQAIGKLTDYCKSSKTRVNIKSCTCDMSGGSRGRIFRTLALIPSKASSAYTGRA